MNTKEILRNLIREEVKKALTTHSLNEAFASPILRRILIGIPGKNGYGSGYSKDIAQAFYNMSKVALDKVEDSDIQKMDPSLAYKTLKKNGGENLIVFYISEQDKANPYAKDSITKQIKAGTLLGIASGDNKFYSMGWQKWLSVRDQRPIMTPGTGDNLGVGKSGSGYGSTGLYNVKRVSEMADVAYVIDLSNLKTTKGTSEKIALRTSQKSGAVAFMTAKQFKQDNIDRYTMILRDKASNSPIDKIVLDTIGLVSDAIKQGVGNLTTGAYDSIIVGRSPRGREVKASDAANFLRQVLDDYERYIQNTKEAKAAAEGGRRDSYYSAQAKEFALALKQKSVKAKNMDYAW